MAILRPATPGVQRAWSDTVASIRVRVWYSLDGTFSYLGGIFKMGISKRAFFIAIGLVLVMVVSACGSTTSTGSTSSTPTATPTTASTSTVQTAQATVSGKALTILTDTQGKTLYYFTPDTAA